MTSWALLVIVVQIVDITEKAPFNAPINSIVNHGRIALQIALVYDKSTDIVHLIYRHISLC